MNAHASGFAKARLRASAKRSTSSSVSAPAAIMACCAATPVPPPLSARIWGGNDVEPRLDRCDGQPRPRQQDVEPGADPRIISPCALEGVVAPKDLERTSVVGLEPRSSQVGVDEIHVTAGAHESSSVRDHLLGARAHVEEDVPNHHNIPRGFVQAAGGSCPFDDARIRQIGVGDGRCGCRAGGRVGLHPHNLTTRASDASHLDQHRARPTTHVDDARTGHDAGPSHQVALTLHRPLSHELKATSLVLGELQCVGGGFLVWHGFILLGCRRSLPRPRSTAWPELSLSSALTLGTRAL
jgi:hypothetical protein